MWISKITTQIFINLMIYYKKIHFIAQTKEWTDIINLWVELKTDENESYKKWNKLTRKGTKEFFFIPLVCHGKLIIDKKNKNKNRLLYFQGAHTHSLSLSLFLPICFCKFGVYSYHLLLTSFVCWNKTRKIDTTFCETENGFSYFLYERKKSNILLFYVYFSEKKKITRKKTE